MKHLSIILLGWAFLLASCAGNHKISKRKAAGLDTITDISLLKSKKRAIYENEKGEMFIMRYEPDPGDSIPEEDSIRLNPRPSSLNNSLQLFYVNKRCDSDTFDGSYRKECKISISQAPLENFNTLRSFTNTLQDPQFMANAIGGSSTPRISEEDRNVRIKKSYLYCYAKQTDEDFHIIIGTSKKPSSTTKYFNVEISGLPPSDQASFALLKAARDSFLSKIAEHVCSSGYYFFEDPLKIELEGSLFFDKQHNGDLIGPEAARPDNAWEIHPTTLFIYN